MGPRLRGDDAAARISTGSAIFSHAPPRGRRHTAWLNTVNYLPGRIFAPITLPLLNHLLPIGFLIVRAEMKKTQPRSPRRGFLIWLPPEVSILL